MAVLNAVVDQDAVWIDHLVGHRGATLRKMVLGRGQVT